MQGVFFWADDLILRARYRGEDVADEAGRVVEVQIVFKREPGELHLEQLDRLDPVHQPWLAPQHKLRAEPADQVESERVECAGPDRGGLLRPLFCDPLGHLARCLVRVGKDEEPARIYALVDELDDPCGERLRLPGPGAGLQDVGSAAVRGGGGLNNIERFVCADPSV